MSPARPVGLGGGCACPLPLVRFPISEEGAEDPPSGHPRDFHQRGLRHRLSPSVQTHPGHPRVPGGDTGRQDLEHRGCDPDGPGQHGFHPEMVTGKGQSTGRPCWAMVAAVWVRLEEALVHLHPAWEGQLGPKCPQSPHTLGSPPTASAPSVT